MSDLPPGWEWATLGDVSTIIQGQSPPGDSCNTAEDGLPFFQGKAEFGSIVPEVRKWTTSPIRLAERGDVLISVRAPVGPTNIAPTRCAIGRGLAAIRSDPTIDSRYLLWAIRVTTDRLADQATGSTFQAINGKVLQNHLIPVAPFAEQRRIVAALEGHLSRLEAGKTALRSARQRAVVAVHSHVQSLLEGLTPDRPLGSVIREPLRNGYSGRASQDGSGVRTLTLTAVTRADFSDKYTKIATVNGRNIAGLWLEPGDILVQRSNTPELVGTSALYVGPCNWAIFPDLLIRVRTNHEVLPAYAHLVLSSPKVHRVLRQSAKGLAGSMPKIDQGTLEGLLIPVPPVATQERIVHRAEEFNRRVRRLSTELVIAQTRGESLRRSLLGDAFVGRLVPQSPDDEPASELLERIRAERVAQPKSERTRRTKQHDTTQSALL